MKDDSTMVLESYTTRRRFNLAGICDHVFLAKHRQFQQARNTKQKNHENELIRPEIMA